MQENTDQQKLVFGHSSRSVGPEKIIRKSLFMDGIQLSQDYRANTRRHFLPLRSTYLKYSSGTRLKDERLNRPWSHPEPLDWESSALTTRPGSFSCSSVHPTKYSKVKPFMSYGTYCTLNAFCSKKLNNHINFAEQQRQLEKIIAKQQAQKYYSKC